MVSAGTPEHEHEHEHEQVRRQLLRSIATIIDIKTVYFVRRRWPSQPRKMRRTALPGFIHIMDAFKMALYVRPAVRSINSGNYSFSNGKFSARVAMVTVSKLQTGKSQKKITNQLGKYRKLKEGKREKKKKN
ncbi:hypothetical protein CLIB1423_07S04280 [[Candida] railenensis]|uniref:Uncharacterized protein n=1 Tax=[Candida] railenensis TaxID=45579 RepID=A0A9P0VYK5_9ASCO|nr:hypothetical protein CLIB1423_07S04280 [[Candida] railenensis]